MERAIDRTRVFWRSFDLDGNLDKAFYLAEGDYTGQDSNIKRALYIGNYYGLDYYQIEELINKAKGE